MGIQRKVYFIGGPADLSISAWPNSPPSFIRIPVVSRQDWSNLSKETQELVPVATTEYRVVGHPTPNIWVAVWEPLL